MQRLTYPGIERGRILNPAGAILETESINIIRRGRYISGADASRDGSLSSTLIRHLIFIALSRGRGMIKAVFTTEAEQLEKAPLSFIGKLKSKMYLSFLVGADVFRVCVDSMKNTK